MAAAEASSALENDNYIYDLKYENFWAAVARGTYITGLQQAMNARDKR